MENPPDRFPFADPKPADPIFASGQMDSKTFFATTLGETAPLQPNETLSVFRVEFSKYSKFRIRFRLKPITANLSSRPYGLIFDFYFDPETVQDAGAADTVAAEISKFFSLRGQ